MRRSSNVVVNLAEENTNGLVLCYATIVFPGVVHLDNPHDSQGCNPAEPAQHKQQLAHVLQRNALQAYTSRLSFVTKNTLRTSQC